MGLTRADLDNPNETVLHEFERISEKYECKLFPSDGPEYIRRNIYLENCTCNWILVLDVDEEITPKRVEKLKQELANVPKDVGAIRISILNYIGYGRWVTTFSPKIIRITNKIKYNEMIYHTTVTQSILENGMKLGRTSHFIEHFGPLYDENEFRKRLNRIHDMEHFVEKGKKDCLLFSMLAVEYISIGKIEKALEYIEKALSISADQDKDFPRFLKALIYYRLNLPWLAEKALLEVTNQKSFTAEAQLLLAELDNRQGNSYSALNRVLPYLEMHPESVHLNLNCAALAVDVDPWKSIKWSKIALELLPTLYCGDIYKKGADYNPYTFQDVFVSSYTNVFDILFRSYMNVGEIDKAKYWKNKEHQIVKYQST